MTKLEELMAKKAKLVAQMKAQLESDDITAAEETKTELVKTNMAISIQKTLDEEEGNAANQTVANAISKTQAAESASFIRAAIKKFTGRKLTETENALLVPAADTTGDNGESYILPQDIQTIIREKIRQYKSIRDVIDVVPTSTLSGSYPVESFETVTELIDFTDGEEGEEDEDIKFTNVKYNLKEKGALIGLSNTLLALSDNALIAYVAKIFAKKAVVTENKMAFAAMTKGKTIKTLSGYRALKSSINKDLDPGVLFGTVVVTNQDGFDYLDDEVDENGRPILQPDPTEPTKKEFKGYPVVVFSNGMLPSTAPTATKDGYAPIFYGNLKEGVALVDLGKTNFATSPHAGFTKNITIARMIEYIDVVQNDASDKCYMAGQIKIADKTGSQS